MIAVVVQNHPIWNRPDFTLVPFPVDEDLTTIDCHLTITGVADSRPNPDVATIPINHVTRGVTLVTPCYEGADHKWIS